MPPNIRAEHGLGTKFSPLLIVDNTSTKSIRSKDGATVKEQTDHQKSTEMSNTSKLERIKRAKFNALLIVDNASTKSIRSKDGATVKRQKGLAATNIYSPAVKYLAEEHRLVDILGGSVISNVLGGLKRRFSHSTRCLHIIWCIKKGHIYVSSKSEKGPRSAQRRHLCNGASLAAFHRDELTNEKDLWKRIAVKEFQIMRGILGRGREDSKKHPKKEFPSKKKESSHSSCVEKIQEDQDDTDFTAPTDKRGRRSVGAYGAAETLSYIRDYLKGVSQSEVRTISSNVDDNDTDTDTENDTSNNLNTQETAGNLKDRVGHFDERKEKVLKKSEKWVLVKSEATDLESENENQQNWSNTEIMDESKNSDDVSEESHSSDSSKMDEETSSDEASQSTGTKPKDSDN
ncbi:hypothetical protein VNO77_13106 [Canavalia gladiata]|uniref:Uncharacterized protein n=1 Tax=Canavalia gladiata TaxID=3824 RepID=A0AAN9QRG4_CANGL